MATVTFRPQAWIKDYVVDMDPQGESKFQVPDELVLGLTPHSYDSDTLREHENCPQWAKDWSGPFECDFVLDTPIRERLRNLMATVSLLEGCDLQAALRDVLTDLRHVAHGDGLDFDFAIKGSNIVFTDELAE